ncbi:TonB family protein [Sphingomonas sp. PB2P19]|uniref:energy transducer TonB n=1 Tax=Sphingomonas rhamnosi TaxID=3096156 RepID=UPI002FC7BE3A
MYADKRTGRFNPGSFAVAMGVNGLVIGALFYAAPGMVPALIKGDPPLVTYAVDLPKPAPLEPQALPEPSPAPRLRAPTPLIAVPTIDQGVTVDPTPYVAPTIDGSVGTGTGLVALPFDPPKPAPVLVQPGIDPRYAADFQPAYPAGERRAGQEGRVIVRVLIGADGRVKQVERVSATNDAFYRATMERALGKWRFTPGTRDGVPVEAWRTMTLRFVLER